MIMKDLRRKQIVSIQYYNSPCGEIILASAGDCLCLCDWNKMPCAERNKHRLMRLLNAECIIAPSAVLEERKNLMSISQASAIHSKFPYIPLVPSSNNKYGKPYLKFRMEKQELTKRLHKR